ncbi:MAG: YdcF family protein [Terracidiphilus sp.]
MTWALLARHFAPASNNARTRFDAIVVLGTRADSDGDPTPRQLARVTEGVAEYERGVAPRIIFSGGAVANRFVEAQVMAQAAEAQGIPASAILEETQANDTIRNACYVTRILHAHGWNSAEIVSSPSQLPRAAMIFGHYPIQWRTHAAPPMEPESSTDHMAAAGLETLKTLYYLLYSSWAERCIA